MLRIFLDSTKGEAAEGLGMYGVPSGVLGPVPQWDSGDEAEKNVTINLHFSIILNLSNWIVD